MISLPVPILEQQLRIITHVLADGLSSGSVKRVA
jgi:hypothetical protein